MFFTFGYFLTFFAHFWPNLNKKTQKIAETIADNHSKTCPDWKNFKLWPNTEASTDEVTPIRIGQPYRLKKGVFLLSFLGWK